MTLPRFLGWLWKFGFFAICLAAMSAAFAAEPRSLKTIHDILISHPNDVPVYEMIGALREVENDRGKKDAYAFWKTFEVACRRAQPDDMQELARIFEVFPADSYYKDKLFSALANASLSREIPPQLPDMPKFPQPTTSLPPAPAGYPQDLREAAERYLQVSAPFQSLTEARKPDQTSTGYQTHKTDYWNLIAQLLAKKDGPFADKFLAYRWGGWCGTGSDQFQDPQSVALLMALARDKRWAEAAGAALNVTPSCEIGGALRVLSVCVPDAKKIVAGALALVDLGPKDYRIEPQRATLLALILCLPGDGRVEALTSLAAHAPPEALPIYFRALGKFVHPGPPPPGEENGFPQVWGGGASGDNLDAIVAEPAGESAQKVALDFLCLQASHKLPIESAENLARFFLEKRRPESIPALRRLLDHPSMSVAQKAADALECLGQMVEIPKKLGPVRYSIRVKGIPYANSKVSWTVKRGSTSTDSEATTDAAGVVELPRDDFLDQSADPIQSVVLHTVSMATPADPWFGVLLAAPPASDDIIPVELKTSSLRAQ